MPVQIMDDDLEAKIAIIEDTETSSYSWTKMHADWTREGGKETITHFRGVWQKNQKEVIGGGSIYGFGGWNRYFVRMSGEVVLSEGHLPMNGTMRAKYVERARTVGMRLSNEGL